MNVFVLIWSDGYDLTEVEGVFTSESNAWSSLGSDDSMENYYVKKFTLDADLDYKTFSIAESRIISCLRTPGLPEVHRVLLEQAFDSFQDGGRRR